MLQIAAIAAVALSGIFYVVLGLRTFRVAHDISDHLPISSTGRAVVESPGEFSAATVATTVSLTTLILAYFELAAYFGPWLLWTAVTTALGLVAVRLAAPLIWQRVGESGAEIPTLHSFLGASFASPSLAFTASLCTTFGFLGALAVELTVGSRFLAELVGFNPQLVVLALSGIAVLYTLLGGFRVVIETDRWQMIAIWAAILALSVLTFLVMQTRGGVGVSLRQVPPDLRTFSWREGLLPFLIGIFIINVPTFLSDMSVWQRIAATRDKSILNKGLVRSIIGAFVSWTLLVVLACLITSLAPAGDETNLLGRFLSTASQLGGALVAVCLFVAILGLYAASLSTASTQLIAASQTVQFDLLEQRKREPAPVAAKRLMIARILVLVLGVGSIAIVEGLRAAGFSITDLVFAIFGAQLGMVPAVLLALLGHPKRNTTRAKFVALGVAAGFLAGWGAAIYGKIVGDGNIVFLAPVASLAAGSLFCAVALVAGKIR